MRESTIEKYLIKSVKESGGRTYKFKSPNNKGVPDRIVIFPRGDVFFVELKAKDGKLSAAQNRRHNELRKQGCTVYVFDNVNVIDEFVNWAVDE